ncbi:unnamed protein product [Lota lota]
MDVMLRISVLITLFVCFGSISVLTQTKEKDTDAQVNRTSNTTRAKDVGGTSGTPNGKVQAITAEDPKHLDVNQTLNTTSVKDVGASSGTFNGEVQATTAEDPITDDVVVQPITTAEDVKEQATPENNGQSNILPQDPEKHGKGGMKNQSKYGPPDTNDESESSHFFTYLVCAALLVALLYIGYHNKRKIFAFVLEGKRSRSVRRPNSKEYKKVEQDLLGRCLLRYPEMTGEFHGCGYLSHGVLSHTQANASRSSTNVIYDFTNSS